MSEKEVLREIKKIFLFLTEQEPTPDDEIEAREKLIEKLKILKNLNSFPDLDNLIEDTLDKLENWETLDFWFKEVDGLSENIEKMINMISKENDIITKPKEEKLIEKKIKTDTSQIDISQVVAQVSEQFKEEINSLKEQIKLLQKELDKKEVKAEKISQKGEAEKTPIIKKPKLEPPKIQIPLIIKPEKSFEVKNETESEVKEPKEEEIEPIIEEEVEPIVEEEVEPIVEEVELPTILPETPEDQEVVLEAQEKPEKALETLRVPKLTPIISETSSRKAISEIPFDVSREPSNEEDLSLEEKDLTPPSKEKLEVISESEKDLKLTIPSVEKSESIPFVPTKPKISPVSVEEIDDGSIKSSSTDLYNVFTSVGTKPSEPSKELEKPVEPISVKTKKKKSEKKRKETESSEVIEKIPSPETSPSKIEVSADTLPMDKDSLYQELIALEGKRYSLEKNYKELEDLFQRGKINDTDYQNRNSRLKRELNEIGLRITNLRRMISNL